jgi:hypothetical protein
MNAPALVVQTRPRSMPLEPGGHQWLAVSAHIVERYLVTFRAPADALEALVPEPLVVDGRRGYGFLSVCALEVRGMGIAGTPALLRFDNLEFLYRVGVRFRDQPTFLTLRSDVSARALAWLGRRFSHYRPRLGRFSLARSGSAFRLACTSEDGHGDALLDVAGGSHLSRDSLFTDAAAAADFLVGMRGSVDCRNGRARVQAIDHDPWQAALARVTCMRFTFLERLAADLGTRFDHDHTLVMRDVRQTWRAARWA